MRTFKKILVPDDFSNHSKEARLYAADLATRYDAHIDLVHVYQPISYSLPEGQVFHSAEQLKDLLAALDVRLAESKADMLSWGTVKSLDTKLVLGSASVEITSLAHDGAYDLIVMGTHGRGGLSHALLGSIAEKVVRTAPCPVLTVRSRE